MKSPEISEILTEKKEKKFEDFATLKEREIERCRKEIQKNLVPSQTKEEEKEETQEKFLKYERSFLFWKVDILREKWILTQEQENFLKNFSEKNDFFNIVLISLVLDPRNFSFEEIENMIKNNRDFYENIKDSDDYIDKNFDFKYLQKVYRENPEIFLKNYSYYVSYNQRIHEFLSEYDKQERWAREAWWVKIWLSDEEKKFLIEKYWITMEELRDYSTILNTRWEKDSWNTLFKRVLFNSILEKIDTFSGKVYRWLSFETKEEFENFLKNFSLTETNQNFTKDIEIAKFYTKWDFKIMIEVETDKGKTINSLWYWKTHIWFTYWTEFEFLEEIDTDFCKVLRFRTK